MSPTTASQHSGGSADQVCPPRRGPVREEMEKRAQTSQGRQPHSLTEGDSPCPTHRGTGTDRPSAGSCGPAGWLSTVSVRSRFLDDGQEICTGREKAVHLLLGPPVLCSLGPLRAASTLPFLQTPIKGLSRSRCSLRGKGEKHSTHSLLSRGAGPTGHTGHVPAATARECGLRWKQPLALELSLPGAAPGGPLPCNILASPSAEDSISRQLETAACQAAADTQGHFTRSMELQ